MKLKLMLMSTFCFFLVSCGGGSGGSGSGDDVYDEYHSLLCKAAKMDESTSYTEAMKFSQEAIDFAQKNQGKMTDLSKMAKAMDTDRC